MPRRKSKPNFMLQSVGRSEKLKGGNAQESVPPSWNKPQAARLAVLATFFARQRLTSLLHDEPNNRQRGRGVHPPRAK